MSKNKTRILLLSCALVVCILALLVGVTYALFSDSALVKNHLDAGKLAIKLERTSLTATRLSLETGLLEAVPANTEVVDFTGTKKDNLFGLDTANNEKTAPGCSYSADMRITNMGDVAFTYSVEIVLDSKLSNSALASQLTVTLTCGETSVSKKLSEGATIDGIAAVLIGESANFTVTVSFDILDEATNNLAQSQVVNFDMIVHAVQKV